MDFSKSFQILVNVTSNIFKIKRKNVKVCPWPRTVVTVYMGRYKIEVCDALPCCFSWHSHWIGKHLCIAKHNMTTKHFVSDSALLMSCRCHKLHVPFSASLLTRCSKTVGTL